MSSERTPLCIEVDQELLDKLKKLAKERGVHPAQAAEELLQTALERPEGREQATSVDEIRRTLTQLTRRVQDLLIPYTGKLDDLQKTVAELVERLEKIEEQVKTLAERPPAPPSTPRERIERRPEQRTPARRTGGGRPTAMERLRQQGAVFQSDLTWLNNPPAFFEKLRREGAIVMQLGGEYVAVDPEYWSRMERTLAQLDEPDPIEAEKKLPSPMNRLFRALYENERAYYDSIEKGWRIIPPE